MEEGMGGKGENFFSTLYPFPVYAYNKGHSRELEVLNLLQRLGARFFWTSTIFFTPQTRKKRKVIQSCAKVLNTKKEKTIDSTKGVFQVVTTSQQTKRTTAV